MKTQIMILGYTTVDYHNDKTGEIVQYLKINYADYLGEGDNYVGSACLLANCKIENLELIKEYVTTPNCLVGYVDAILREKLTTVEKDMMYI